MSDRWLFVLVTLPLTAYVAEAIRETATRRSLGPLRRVAWCVFLIVVPIASLVVYVVVRPPRAVRRTRRRRLDTGRASAIVELAEQRQRGELDDDRYHAEVRALIRADAG